MATSSTAHAQALFIPEDVVNEILVYVRAEPVSEQRPILARLARVCRAFRDPAVRMLWAELPSMDPLFKLLSNCVPLPAPAPANANAAGNNAQAPQPLYTLALQGPTSNEDIARLRDYASLVRVLDFPSSGIDPDHTPRGVTLEPQSLDNLLLQTGLPLLPSLTKLKLPVTPPYLSDPTFLICPSLRELTISFPGYAVSGLTANIGGLFGGIFAQNTLLSHLRVQSESFMRHDPKDLVPWQPSDKDWMFAAPDEDIHIQAFCDALAAVDMLQVLEVFSMITMNTGIAGTNLITALSGLPQLRECSFGVDIPAAILTTINPGFPSLRALTISNVASGTELNLFASPHLHDLTMYHPRHTTNDAMCHAIEVTSQRFPGLRRLAWHLCREEITSAIHILVATIPPLFALNGLRELSIDANHRRVYDDDIALLAGGLPRLEHLALNFYMREGGPGPSGQALLALAQGCPSLQTLHLGGLFITETNEAQTEAYPFVGHRLRSLSIADLRCASEVLAAVIIDLLFPYLDIQECRSRADTGRWRKRRWCEVLDRLEVYHAQRE